MADNLLDKASILLTPTAYNDGSMLSVKPENGDGDFTFSRGSAATRVNAQGLVENVQIISSELVSNGDFATDSDWLFGGSASISNGSANFTGSGDLIRQNIITPVGTYKVTFTVTGTGYLVVKNLTGGTSYREYTNISQGEHTIYIEKNEDGIMFQSFGFASSIDNVSVKEITDDTDLPRIDYTDGCGSWLLEPQSTNLTPYSEDFSQSAWVKTGLNITSNSIASPSGEVNADKWVEDTSNGAHNIRNNPNISVTNGAEYTMSIFAKAGERTGLRFTNAAESSVEGRFDLSNGTVTFTGTNTTFVGVEDYGNGWYRCIVSFVASTTIAQLNLGLMDGSALSYQGDGTSGLYAWGAQLENLSYATSYILTNGAIATRLADVATNSGSSSLINSTEGVLYAEIAALADDLNIEGISISDGSISNRVVIFKWSNSNSIRARVSSNGINVLNQTFSVSDITDFNKIAISYKLNEFKVYINGTNVFNGTSGAVPIGLNTLSFDTDGTSFTPFYGKNKALAVYKEALTDAELQSLTTI